MTKAPSAVAAEQLRELGLVAPPAAAKTPGGEGKRPSRDPASARREHEHLDRTRAARRAAERYLASPLRPFRARDLRGPAEGGAADPGEPGGTDLLADIEIDDRERRRRSRPSSASRMRALAAGVRRDDALVAVGGGVVSRRGGFAAAILLRGIAWSAVPTTTGAMADAAIGGKTGVDHAPGRTCSAPFIRPAAVLIDPEAAATLPDRDFRAGLVEAFKAAWIADAGVARSAEDAIAGPCSRREEAPLLDLLAGRPRQGRDRVRGSAGEGIGGGCSTSDTRSATRSRRPADTVTCATARRWPGGSRRRSRSPGRAGLREEDAAPGPPALSRLGPFPEPSATSRRPRALPRPRQEGDGAGHRGRGPGGGRPGPDRRGDPRGDLARGRGQNVHPLTRLRVRAGV